MKNPAFVPPSKSAIMIEMLFHRTFIMNCVENDSFLDDFQNRLADKSDVLEAWLFNDVLAPKLVEQEVDVRGAKEDWNTMRDLPVPTFVNSVINARLDLALFREGVAQVRESKRIHDERLQHQTRIIADCYREEIPTRADDLNKILSGEVPAHHAVKLQFGIPSDKVTLAQAMVHLIMVGKKGIDFTGFNSVNPYAGTEENDEQGEFTEEF